MKRLILIFCLIATPLWAVLPDEILDDPVLEARARSLSKELRCVVCRGENIDESNAGIARDLRLLVRERLTDGDTDQQVLDFVVGRYGEYVLMRPTVSGVNIVLYATPMVLLLLALYIGITYTRRRASAPEVAAAGLSKAEAERLRDIMKD